MSEMYGYAMVSTKEQREGSQRRALEEVPISEARIYMDRQSGKGFNRPQYQNLLRRLKPDDVMVVESIDRLGRNYAEILEQWRVITKEKRADIVVLDMPLLDTRKSRDLTGTRVSDIVLQLLAYAARTERETILRCRREGIAAAKARGMKIGRPCIRKPKGYAKIREQWLKRELSSREAGRRLHVSQDTFLRWVHGDGG